MDPVGESATLLLRKSGKGAKEKKRKQEEGGATNQLQKKRNARVSLKKIGHKKGTRKSVGFVAKKNQKQPLVDLMGRGQKVKSGKEREGGPKKKKRKKQERKSLKKKKQGVSTDPKQGQQGKLIET